MELTSEHKNPHSPDGEKSSVIDKADIVTPLNDAPTQIIVDDVELNEDQLDIISGGGDGQGLLIKTGG